MKFYSVTIPIKGNAVVQVTADSKDQAKRRALDAAGREDITEWWSLDGAEAYRLDGDDDAE